MTNNTDNKTEPAHDCAAEVAKALSRAIYSHAKNKNEWYTWEQLTDADRAAWIAGVKELPAIITRHAAGDVQGYFAGLAGASSGWRKYLYGAVAASALWLASLLCSCSPVTPGQVRQWDEAHALMHRMTDTDCTLFSPTVLPAK